MTSGPGAEPGAPRAEPQPVGAEMAGPEAVRYAIIGFGLAGRVFHAPFIAAVDGAVLAAVVARSPERAREVSSAYPDVSVVDTIEALPGLGIHAAVVATPNETHAEVAEAVMELGLAAVVDKPLAATVAEAERLIAVAGRTGRLLTCYQNRRWDGDFLTVRQLRDEGRLGAIHRFESRFERWRPAVKPGWKEVPSPGAGVLFDLGPHVIDQAIHLLGPVTSTYSEVRTLRDGALVPDDAFLALTHAGGAVSHLWVSHMAGAPGPRFRVLGSEAAYVKDGLDPQEDALRAGAMPRDDTWGSEPESNWGRLWRAPDSGPVRTVNGDYREFYRLLTRALRSGGAPPVDPRDSLAALRIIESASTV